MTDIQQTPEGDLDLTTGDITLSESTEQHKSDILLASQGDISDAPLIGVDIVGYLNSEDNDLMLRDIAIAMERDGIKVDRIRFIGRGQLSIEGRYATDNN